MLVWIAIALFITAALLGLRILLAILKDKPTPKPFVLSHGPLAALAIVLLIIEVVRGNTDGLLITSLIIFILAAIGGFTLYTLDMLKKDIPKPIAIAHPIVAATGLAVLIFYALQ
ncbi:hypothetical protein [Legionella londiniensis]|uniref:Transmembrane protein n=1 Tax=Legionella londiniensis TaxID=45068 RepID=A0A0W0VP37_9GAMM|nr:hypothetical protein [Legionella londiniensis]KTD21827.1 hypothetical protein Llon_0992 [Legionella londiniensis]STX92690.1 Uncharacterised protein [Legionella londiniensis]